MQIIDTGISENYILWNGNRTWSFTSPYLFYPTSLRGVRHCVLQAQQDGKQLRATGSQHSFSDVVNAEGQYLLTLSRAHPYDEERHNQTVDLLDQKPIDLLYDVLPSSVENYINVPGGLKIRMLNTILCPDNAHMKARFGRKRLFNMGGGDVQAVAGALSTGTHGSGGKHSGYHDMVRSILIVASDGRLLRIEPEKGITEPDKHKAAFENAGPDDKIELIQDDKLFYSCLVSLGCFGIIYSVILEVTDMNNLHEDVYYLKQGWESENLQNSIAAKAELMKNGADLYYYVYINPYTVTEGKPNSCNEKIVVVTENAASGRMLHRNVWPTFFALLDPAAELTRSLANSNAQPCAGLIETALKAINDNANTPGGGFTDIAYKVWNTGAGELKTLGTGIEFGFPYTMENLTVVMNHTLAALKSFAERGNMYYLNSPIAIRFARASEAYLATNYKFYKGEQYDLWFYLEFTCINGEDGEGDKREVELYKYLQQYLMMEDPGAGKVSGRPHWGLNFEFPFGKEFLRSMYPAFDTWVEAFKIFNTTGTFDNKITDALELRVNDGGNGDPGNSV